MNKFEKLLVQLRIMDADKTLSLTSILMMVLIVKIAMVPVLDWASLGVILLTLVNYNIKRVSYIKSKKVDDSVQDKLKKIEENTQDRLNKMDTELKQLISSNELQKLRR